jgi:putative hydrolase of the HAD superfamily
VIASARRLVIFDAFNTLVTARRGHEGTFLAGLGQAGLDATVPALAGLQKASEGLDHSAWSTSRQRYVQWAAETLQLVRQAAGPPRPPLAARLVPALEQLHQAPMVAMPGARDCLAVLRDAGFAIAICSNWGWDLTTDIQGAGLAADVDAIVTSAQAGFRKPHPRIYQAALTAAGFGAAAAVFVGDSPRTDFLGPRSAGIRSVLLDPSAPSRAVGDRARSLAEVAWLLMGGDADLGRPALG